MWYLYSNPWSYRNWPPSSFNHLFVISLWSETPFMQWVFLLEVHSIFLQRNMKLSNKACKNMKFVLFVEDFRVLLYRCRSSHFLQRSSSWHWVDECTDYKKLLLNGWSHKLTNRGTPKFLTLKHIQHDRSNKLGLNKYWEKTRHHVCSSWKFSLKLF